MNNVHVMKHLKNYCKKNDWGTSDDDIREVLTESEYGDSLKWKGDQDEHRWYNNFTVVVEIDGMLIKFTRPECTGDNGLSDMGLDQWPLNLVEVEPKTVKTIEYVPKDIKQVDSH